MHPLTFAQVFDGVGKICDNARALVRESRLLVEAEALARGYTLAHLAREELAKVPMLYRAGVQLLLDLTPDWKRLSRRFHDHRSKLRQDVLGSAASASDVVDDPLTFLRVGLAGVDKRNEWKNRSLYVSWTSNGFASPFEAISAHLANRTIILAEFALKDCLGHLQTLEVLSKKTLEELRGAFKNIDTDLTNVDPETLARETLELAAALNRAIDRKRADRDVKKGGDE